MPLLFINNFVRIKSSHEQVAASVWGEKSLLGQKC